MMKNTVFNAFLYSLMVFCSLGVFIKSTQANENHVFTVNNIEIDITARNSSVARSLAMEKAQLKAYDVLIKRLISDSIGQYDTEVTTDIIATMINDFEVTSEKISAVRYVGVYTIRFKPDKVKRFLSELGVSYSDVSSKPVLVLPFMHMGHGKNVMWGNNNLWFNAWKRTKTDKGLVPVRLPIGDLDDISDISDNEALTYQPENLQKMIDRYDVEQLIIVIADYKNFDGAKAQDSAKSLYVYVYSAEGNRPRYVETLVLNPYPSEKVNQIMGRMVIKVKEFMQNSWKNKTVVASDQNNELDVVIMFGNIKEWVDTYDHLETVQGIAEVSIVSLSSKKAKVKIKFKGNEKRLRLALEQSDITLTVPELALGYGDDLLIYKLYLDKYTPKI